MDARITAMPRTPVAATARKDRISVRATVDELADMDELRGSVSRSDFIRSLLHVEKDRRDAARRN